MASTVLCLRLGVAGLGLGGGWSRLGPRPVVCLAAQASDSGADAAWHAASYCPACMC